MAFYHVDGVPGTGKTTICNELAKRGFIAIDADTISRMQNRKFCWIPSKVIELLRLSETQPVFLCGTSYNSEQFRNLFDKRITLYVHNHQLKKRIAMRKGNDYGRRPEDLQLILRWNKHTILWSQMRRTELIKTANLTPENTVDKILNFLLPLSRKI